MVSLERGKMKAKQDTLPGVLTRDQIIADYLSERGRIAGSSKSPALQAARRRNIAKATRVRMAKRAAGVLILKAK
jgi:hypothetical protein